MSSSGVGGRGSHYIAVDLGAESGRVQLGTLAGGRVKLEEIHRFVNGPVRLPSGLHWDVLGIHREVLTGIGLAARRADGPIDGIAVDAWGCDYGLLDRDGELLGNPFHYRDDRTDGVMERLLEEIPRDEVYATTGIQFMGFNTLFQLASARGSAALESARALATIPDLLAYWLSGRLAGERTAASTTQLLDVNTGEWARELLLRAGLDPAILPPLVDAGTVLAPLREEIATEAGLDPVPDVIAVGGHDTASAVVAAPARGRDFAYLSSGTWSLLGMELDSPATGADALAYNLTNEGGVAQTVRLLRNVMGLWLVQECRRQWAREGVDHDYDALHRMAASTPLGGPLIDPDDDSLLPPGDMPARIAQLCRDSGQEPPRDAGATIRCALESLACKYRLVLERIEQVAGRRAEVVHVVGGGARNATLCQLAADILDRPVHAGPIEATALGNVMTQALAQGRVGSLEEIREVVAASFAPDVYEPAADRTAYEDLYARFLSRTGLSARGPAESAERPIRGLDPVTAFAPTTQGTDS